MSNVIFDPERWESVEAGSEAVIDRWLVTEGDYVLAEQPLALATLVHQDVTVEAPRDGVLEQIVLAAGERFGRGTVLARLIDV
jgi:pyruvate/2-oxoglutarate dehydrogenase complex dihydrolipoamide acyltransferase (E2) component